LLLRARTEKLYEFKTTADVSFEKKPFRIHMQTFEYINYPVSYTFANREKRYFCEKKVSFDIAYSMLPSLSMQTNLVRHGESYCINFQLHVLIISEYKEEEEEVPEEAEWWWCVERCDDDDGYAELVQRSFQSLQSLSEQW